MYIPGFFGVASNARGESRYYAHNVRGNTVPHLPSSSIRTLSSFATAPNLLFRHLLPRNVPLPSPPPGESLFAVVPGIVILCTHIRTVFALHAKRVQQ